MLHPSGTHMLCRGFTGKSVRQVELEIPHRADKIQSAFFHRPRNDTSLMNTNPSMSMLDSAIQPYMFEDTIHARWVPFLLKSHLTLVQEWDHVCVLHGTDVLKRGVRVNDSLRKIVLSDMYRSLDPSLLPCNDTLLYGVYYPLLGAGMGHTAEDNTWNNVTGWVYLRDATHSQIHIFKSDSVVMDEPAVEEGCDDEDMCEPVYRPAGDTGCAESHYEMPAKDVFSKLRKERLLVLPVVNRPGAVLWHPDQKCYGMLAFDLDTGHCYNPVDGCYTMRVNTKEAAEASLDDIVGNEIKLTPLELETMLLGVPTHVFVDTQAFAVDGVSERFIPEGSNHETLLKCSLWYPGAGDLYLEDHVYLLAHVGGANSSSYSLIHCDVSFLVHPDEHYLKEWTIISSIRNCD
jgi:hypothetical protein